MPSTTLHIAVPGSNDGDHHQLFTHLFRNYGSRIFFYFLKYVKRKDVAEDLLQEVFASVWTKRDKLLQDNNIEAYLFVTARNQLYNYLKRMVADIAVTAPEEMPARPYQHVEEAVDYKEVQVAYYEALAALPTQRRKAFILSREHGFTYQQIAEQMGISPRTVEKHISEALQLMRGKLGASYTVAILFIIW